MSVVEVGSKALRQLLDQVRGIDWPFLKDYVFEGCEVTASGKVVTVSEGIIIHDKHLYKVLKRELKLEAIDKTLYVYFDGLLKKIDIREDLPPTLYQTLATIKTGLDGNVVTVTDTRGDIGGFRLNDGMVMWEAEAVKLYADPTEPMHAATKQYVDTLIGVSEGSVKEYVDAQDAAYSAEDQAYADAQDEAHSLADRAYMVAQDEATLAEAKTYADTQDDAHSLSDRAYADSQAAAAQAAAELHADTEDDAHSLADRSYTDTQVATRAPATHVGKGGTDEHPNATTSTAGFMSVTDKTKLDAATSLATPSTLIIRDASGRAQVAAPAAPEDIARKDTVDAKPDLGETSTTAYRGDRGKVAYDHSQSPHLVLGETATTAHRGDHGKAAYEHSQTAHLALGETSSTAYRGDRGKVAYDHSQSAHAPADANYYEHPATHPATMVTEDSTHRFVTDAEKTTWNGKQDSLGFTPVNKAGDTMTGALTLSGAPTALLHAATKKYVDDSVGAAGGGDMMKSTYDSNDDGVVNAADAVPWTGITDKPSSFPPSTHGHAIADVTNLQTTLNGKVDSSRVLTDVPADAKFTDTVTTINGKTGAITKADIVALGIPAQDTVYTHPANHPASIITQDSSNRFVTDEEKATWNAKSTLALGETSETAYRGDRGKTAYEHSQVVTGAVHGAVATATANRLMVRDANGRAQVAAPSAAADIARKDTVDAVLGTGNTSVAPVKAVLHERHTRSTVLTHTSGVLTKVEEKDGSTVVCTTDLIYTDGVLTGVEKTAGGVKTTLTLNYTDGVLTSVTRSVT